MYLYVRACACACVRTCVRMYIITYIRIKLDKLYIHIYMKVTVTQYKLIQ